jgi:hypothetical protein
MNKKKDLRVEDDSGDEEQIPRLKATLGDNNENKPEVLNPNVPIIKISSIAYIAQSDEVARQYKTQTFLDMARLS